MSDPIEYPVLERQVWLNHAAISPWPAAVIDAVRGYVDDNAERGPLDYDRWLKTEQRLRERAVRLFDAESDDDVAIVKNTSEGLSLIAAGLDWQRGDRLVCAGGEFPSNRLPWQHLVPEFVEVHEVPFCPEDPETPLLDALDDRTRLVAVSSVRYDSGIRLDLARLGTACRAAGALLAVDAIQHLGAMPLSVRELPVDFVVAGSHKWLLAPEGLALFWSRPEARRRLRPVQAGWRMWPDMFEFSRDDERIPDAARRFEPGTLNTAGIHGLDAALGTLLAVPTEKRAERLLSGTGRLIDGLSELPAVEVVTPRDDARRAGIVTFRADGVDPRRLLGELRRESIIAAPRGGGLRLSPHHYTPTEQIDRALAVLRRLLS